MVQLRSCLDDAAEKTAQVFGLPSRSPIPGLSASTASSALAAALCVQQAGPPTVLVIFRTGRIAHGAPVLQAESRRRGLEMVSK